MRNSAAVAKDLVANGDLESSPRTRRFAMAKASDSTHPIDELLRSFLHGELHRRVAVTIETHLTHCSICVRRLERMPDHNRLVTLVRQGSTRRSFGPTGDSPMTDPNQTQDDPAAIDVARGRTAEDMGTRDDAFRTADEADGTPMPSDVSDVLTGAFNEPGGVEEVPATATAPQPTSRLDAYEILGELGEGGMGVVYKARQIALNRLVALKMVLTGGRASARQLARFHIEAMAVARLEHPNIVRIYDSGDDNGVPFFAMEFVDGVTLEKQLRRQPMEPTDAAKMAEALARAMQHAHERGIIHRDLKPANIMLTKAGEPKITDFGLAKQLDSDTGQTNTGAVMGTPNYMAPEQAEGKTKEVTALADVYALGATLYEMITGRPPFQGPSVVSVIDMVKTREPVAPTQLQPRLPRDLETICLKCLQKDPSKRYASAGEMADDLRRFLNGEPILARPVGRIERLVRWCKRNPRVTALSGIAALLLVLFVTTVAIAAPLLYVKNRELETTNQQLSESIKEYRAQSAIATRQNELNAEQVRYLTRSLLVEFRSQGSLRRQRERLVDYLTKNLERLEKLTAEGAVVTDRAAISLLVQRAELHEELYASDPELAPDSVEKAESCYRRALELAAGRAAAEPESDVSRANYAFALHHLARFLLVKQPLTPQAQTEAEELGTKALALRQANVESPRSERESRHYIFPANARASLADSHELAADLATLRNEDETARRHLDVARTLMEEAIALIKADHNATDESLGIAPFQQHLAALYLRLAGDFAAQKKAAEAQTYLEKALDLQEKVVDDNADSVPNKQLLAQILFRSGVAHLIAHRDQQARADFDRMFLLMNAVATQGPEETTRPSRWQASLALYGVGVASARLGDRQKAVEAFRDCVKMRRRLVAEIDDAMYQRGLMVALARSGDHEAALEVLNREKQKRPTEQFWFNAVCTYSLAAESIGRWADDAKLTPDQKKLRTSYITEALQAVQTLADMNKKRLTSVETDPDLEYLRSRPEFKSFMTRFNR